MRRIERLGFEVDLHNGRLDIHLNRLNKLTSRVETIERVAATGLQLETLEGTIHLLYDYLGLEICRDPQKTYIAKRGQKKR